MSSYYPIDPGDERPSPRGDRSNVGRGQVLVVEFPVGYALGTATEFSIILDHVPTSATPRGSVSTLAGGASNAVISQAQVGSWTKSTVMFSSDTSAVRQTWLVN